jgi:hypothetical protein
MNKKQSIITFKVDDDFMSVIKDIPNRSEFIRSAIIEALGSVCPLCNGSGMLSKKKKKHWDDFAVHHYFQTCSNCDEQIIVCGKSRRRTI